jgi:hypothetical protein
VPSPTLHNEAPPRHHTPRNPDRATFGGHAALIAASLGKPLIPWQRRAVDVALEVDDDGVFVYPIVLITVQRQAGKSELDLSCGIQNALLGPNRRVWYTAQTGQDAADRWLELAETFDESRLLRPLAYKGSRGIRRSNGSQQIHLKTGSKYRPHPPTRSSLHGKQSDRNTIDEAWWFTSAQGTDLIQAISPTTTTRKVLTGQRPQLWIMSTEGTIESTFFNPLLDAARAGDPDICLVDYGIPDDVDPTDLDVIAKYHPGYGHLLDMATIRDQQKLFAESPGELARALGNRRTGAPERVIPVEAFRRASWGDPFPAGRVCLAASVGIDGIDTTIAVGVRVENGPTVAKVVRDGHRIGTHWAIGRLVDLVQKHKAPVVIDKRGPSAALHDAAKRAGLNVIEPSSADVSAAHQTLLEGITTTPEPTWRYESHPAIAEAAELATRRYFSDGAWVFGRRASVGSISGIEAPALAAWGADHLPVEGGIQVF